MDAKTTEQARLATALHARMEAIYRAADYEHNGVYIPGSTIGKWENEAVQEFMAAMNRADM